MPRVPPVEYVIDGDDRIVEVNQAWDASAREAGEPRLTRPRVLGRSLWDEIREPTTRQLLTALLTRVRSSRRPVGYGFRCDTPSQRRLFRLGIQPEAERLVRFQSQAIAIQDRPAAPLLERRTPRSNEFLTICGWCKRLLMADRRWVEVEEAMEALDLLDQPTLPRLTHGMCPACHAAVTAMLDDSAPGTDVNLGALPPE